MPGQTQWHIVALPSLLQPVSNINKLGSIQDTRPFKIYAAHVYVYSAREHEMNSIGGFTDSELCILAYIMYSNLLCKLLKVHYITVHYSALISRTSEVPIFKL